MVTASQDSGTFALLVAMLYVAAMSASFGLVAFFGERAPTVAQLLVLVEAPAIWLVGVALVVKSRRLSLAKKALALIIATAIPVAGLVIISG